MNLWVEIVENFLHVVDGDCPIREPGGEHVRMLGVDVDAHDPAVGRAKILGERRVLQGEDAHVAGDALVLRATFKVVGRCRYHTSEMNEYHLTCS